MNNTQNQAFIESFEALSTEAHNTARENGWWDSYISGAEAIALMLGELSEALEALRNGNGPDKNLPQFIGTEVEPADVIIWIMDLARERGWKVAEALVAKMAFNKTRPHKHGKEF